MACSQVLPRTQYWKLECCLWGTECSCQHCSRGQRGRWTYGSHILFVLFHHPPLCDCHHCLLGMCLCNGSCPPVDWVAQISLPQWTARTESHHCLPSWDIDVHWNMSALTITANSVNTNYNAHLLLSVVFEVLSVLVMGLKFAPSCPSPIIHPIVVWGTWVSSCDVSCPPVGWVAKIVTVPVNGQENESSLS